MIHSFIPDISIAPLQVHYYSEALLTIARILCFTLKRHRQLRGKDLPKVPTWRLERDSNPRPFGRKATYLPMSHQAHNYMNSSLGSCMHFVFRAHVCAYIYMHVCVCVYRCVCVCVWVCVCRCM